MRAIAVKEPERGLGAAAECADRDQRGGHEDIVFIVSIRPGSRMPLGEPEYMRRWLEESSKVPD